jgi:general secretion pathway protein J
MKLRPARPSKGFSMGSSKGSSKGFTLIELLVAMAIFSFLAAAMYTGIRQIVLEREIVMQRNAELYQMQRAVRYLSTDFSQLHPRDVRDELGRDYIGSLTNNPSQGLGLVLSRDGWRNPAESNRGTLQRVQYRLDDETLYREYWPVMDHLLGDEPRSLMLIEGVEEFEVAFLDETLEWQTTWPPLTSGNTAPAQTIGARTTLSPLPRAVRYRMKLKSFGEIERLVEIPR